MFTFEMIEIKLNRIWYDRQLKEAFYLNFYVKQNKIRNEMEEIRRDERNENEERKKIVETKINK